MRKLDALRGFIQEELSNAVTMKYFGEDEENRTARLDGWTKLLSGLQALCELKDKQNMAILKSYPAPKRTLFYVDDDEILVLAKEIEDRRRRLAVIEAEQLVAMAQANLAAAKGGSDAAESADS